jgi:tetratricopeptide (TPR) repeat protein
LGIPIGGGRRKKRRRSYADYKPPKRRQGPRDDPFRIIFYLALIAGVGWIYVNRDMVRDSIFGQFEGAAASVQEAANSMTPTPLPDDYAEQGAQAFRDGKLEDAIEYYRQAAVFAPNQVEYHVEVARLLLFRSALQYGEGREITIDEAVEAANGAILADPDRPEGYAIMGKVLDWNGRPEEGTAQILRALEKDEDYAPAHSYLAEALIDMDQWERAQESIQTALKLNPNHVDIRRDYAYILESLGDYAGASTQYEAAIAIEPNLPYLHVSLGRVYRVLGRYNEALDQFFEAERFEPQNALIPLEVGRTYETYIGDINSAVEYYERSVEIDEAFVTPWVRIGTIRYVQGRYPQAIIAFERALELGEDGVEIQYQLGIAYANQQECDEALPHLREARNMAQEDELILDIVESGFETCAQIVPGEGELTDESEDGGQ